MPRDYSPLLHTTLPRGDRALRVLIDRLWDHLAPTGVSWIGVYFFEFGVFPETGAGCIPSHGMVLGPCRDKPACSPIGLYGACGRSYLTKRSLVVTDVKHLGTHYVACDPRDRSELVIPLLDEHGNATGVLDADSFDANSFTAHDALEAARVLHAHGFLRVDPASIPIDVV